MKKALFDKFADIYDQDMARSKHLKGDINMYLRYAKKQGSPILDLCCGTGRVAIPLIEAGYDVTGVELSKKMLKKFVDKWPMTEKRYFADVLTWDTSKRFKMIILADDSLLHFTTLEDQLEVLKKCRKWLKTGGILIVDILRQHYEDLVKYPKKVFDYRRDGITRERSILPDFGSQVNEITYYYNGRPVKNMIRWISYPEAILLFKAAGLRPIKIYGDYKGGKCSYGKGKMIFVLKKNV